MKGHIPTTCRDLVAMLAVARPFTPNPLKGPRFQIGWRLSEKAASWPSTTSASVPSQLTLLSIEALRPPLRTCPEWER